jgi:hypothetical protein
MRRAVEQSADVEVRRLLGDLAEGEKKLHAQALEQSIRYSRWSSAA